MTTPSPLRFLAQPGTAGAGNVIAVVGTMDPRLPGLAFISLEELLSGTGVRRLKETLALQAGPQDAGEVAGWSRETLLARTLESLQEHLQSVDPAEALAQVAAALAHLEERLERPLDTRRLLRMLVHTTCMVDRLRRDPPVPYPNLAATLAAHGPLAAALRASLAPLAEQFGVAITDDELGYLVDLLTD